MMRHTYWYNHIYFINFACYSTWILNGRRYNKISKMTIDDIKALIANDESRTLELKKTTGELKDGMHTACAFLNTDGGWLIFGIAPKSLKIIGQEVSDATKRELSQAFASFGIY